MESHEGARFRQGSGRLCLDFARTLRHRGLPTQREELGDAEALADWLTQFGPDLGRLLPTSAQVREAQRLREAVHELVASATDPSRATCRSSTRERLNRAASVPLPSPRLTPSGRLRWQADDPVVAMFASIARDALDLVSSPAIDRVRECAGEDCCALFYDSSRPGARRWCDMDICGNHAKKHTLRGKSAG